MIDKIVCKLEEANLAYRKGYPIMSDLEYDNLLEELILLDPDNIFLDKIGIDISDSSRKVKLPIIMASMNKIKTLDDIKDWLRLKNIPKNTEIICTPKYDGLSLVVSEVNNSASTRGDGIYGQKSDEHYKLIKNHLCLDDNPFEYTYGEVIMPKSIFKEKYSSEFANPRNLVAGLLNSKDTSNSLEDIIYIKYGGVLIDGFHFRNKSDILDNLNLGQEKKVEYHLSTADDITEELLIELFSKWSFEYEIDGIILEVNDISLQEKLGRETSSSNPCYSRAFKHESFVESKITKILYIEDNISKNGLIKPVAVVEPISLDGVTVSRCTLNNYKFVLDNGLGPGAVVKIVRSGMVIPLIVEVLETVEFTMPIIEGVEIVWNENGIELITLTETDEQKIKKNIAFFEILDANNVGEGVITQLWDAGYKTIKDILGATKSDLQSIDRFGKRKAEIVFNSIRKATTDVDLSKLQHATGIFSGLGSKKLILLEKFKTKPSMEQVMEIEGFAEISASNYIENYDLFFDFIKGLPISISEKREPIKTGNQLDGKTFVFTGIRRGDLVDIINSRGGKEVSSISKNVTYLICKDKESISSKMTKATNLGVSIMSIDELEEFLK